jgi:hypothetical protein
LSRALAWRRVVPGLLFGALNRREQPLLLTITRAQRDAIYEIVIPHLTAIGDVWLCVKRREFAEAKNDEELAERDVAASETLGAILGQLARQSGGEEVAR